MLFRSDRQRRVEIVAQRVLHRLRNGRSGAVILTPQCAVPAVESRLGLLQAVLVEVERLAVMRRQQQQANDFAGILIEQFVHDEEVAERLAHLLTRDVEEAVVHPVLRHNGVAERRATLRDLVLVVREDQVDAARMAEEMVKHMHSINEENIKGTARTSDAYVEDVAKGKKFTLYLGDCVEVVRKLPDASVGFSVFSPPFASLYTYSASDRDMGNSKDYDEFSKHFEFLAHELFRVIMPGRLLSCHCMNLPTSKSHHGYIGLQDFRGDLIRCFQRAGFIFHSEVCIWKDPVTAMQRTKALGLLHKQIVKDSCMSRQGVPDYLVTMRKPGDNPEPVEGELDRWIGDNSFKSEGHLSIDLWQRYASPVWMDIRASRTLQKESAREEKDERHICPLQLDVIERAIELWSNSGDLVFSPFTGIGSEGYVALINGRRFVGAELKASYWKQAASNLALAETNAERDLFTQRSDAALNTAAHSL